MDGDEALLEADKKRTCYESQVDEVRGGNRNLSMDS